MPTDFWNVYSEHFQMILFFSGELNGINLPTYLPLLANVNLWAQYENQVCERSNAFDLVY